jgi:hypothetical protein
MSKRIVLVTGMLCAATVLAQGSRKFIGHGWDFLGVSPQEVLANADALDKTGLDGISISLSKTLPDGKRLSYGSILNEPAWAREAFKDDIPTLQAISRHPSLRHSFLTSFWTPHPRLAWADDAAWERFANNIGVQAWVAKQGGMEGLMVDPEDYSGSRQFYRAATDPEYPACAALARKRGAQIMSAIAKEYPDVTILSFWFLSMERGCASMPDTAAAMAGKGTLWPAFINGMLDVIPPGAKLVDGDEGAYSYEATRQDFYVAAWNTLSGVLSLVAPENHSKYRNQAQASFGTYMDCYTNPTNSPYYFGPYNGSRLAHLEMNFRQAMRVANEYVWVYGEKHAWIHWKGIREKRFMEMRTWEEDLPGLAESMAEIKNPVGAAARSFAKIKASGGNTNLVSNPTCASKEPLSPDTFHAGKTPAPFGTWQDENQLQGVFGLDTATGRGDKSSLCMKGVGSGCFTLDIPHVKFGERYLVSLAAKGAEPHPTVYWQRDGHWDWGIPGVELLLGKPEADGWRTASTLVDIPGGADKMVILLNARQEAGQQTWYDNVEVYRIR